MKTILGLVAVVSFFLGLAGGAARPAAAYEGAMCVDSHICGRCEVCVKSTGQATGTCMKIQGCY